MDQIFQYLIDPVLDWNTNGAGYGTEKLNLSWNPAPNHSQMQATTYYHPLQQPTLVPPPQQHYFPKMEQHNQDWLGIGPRAEYGTEPGQQNMNWIPDPIHNQMQAMVTTSNITNHPALYNLLSTSASQVSHTRKKGRPRLSDDKSIKARYYKTKKRDVSF
jgi:hypothetical protein